jgi:DNA-binding SARP family transcriptional activator
MTAHGPGFHLRLRTLGPTPRLVGRDGEGPEQLVLGPGKPLAVVIYLGMRPDRSASRDHLTDLLWADSELERARQSLRQALWQIRRKLGDGALTSDGDLVTLGVGLPADYADFSAALQEGRFADAVSLYDGDFLAEFGAPGGAAFEQWADVARERLRSGWLRALDALARERMRDGHARDAVVVARRLRHAAPDQEGSWRLLLQALLQAGDRVSAGLEADNFERVLADQEREPEPQSRALLARVRSEPPAAPAAARPRLTAELIGRAGQFRRLIQGWERARSGEGSHLHLTAPAGLGKTRLLQDAERRLRAVGGRIIYLRAAPGFRGISYGFAAELARALLRLPGAAAVAPGALPSILALDPSLAVERGGAPDPSTGAEALRRRTLALADLVTAVGAEAPVALLLDDTHWMDGESLQLVSGIAARLRAAPVLLVTSGRPVQAAAGVAAGAEVLELPPLSEPQVEELVTSLGRLPPEPWAVELVRRLHATSGGSPLRVLEGLELGLDGGWLALEGDAWRCPDRRRIAGDLVAGDAVRRRIERLEAAHRRVVLVLAAAATPLRAATLAEAADLPPAEVAAVLAGLEERGFTAVAEDHWRLAHDELEEAGVGLASPAEVADLRRRTGAALGGVSPATALDLRRAAALLAEGGDDAGLVPLYGRWLRAAVAAGDPRTDVELARALLGEAATPTRMRALLRARPLRRRLGLVGRGRLLVAGAASAVIVGSLLLGEGSRPARIVLLQAPIAGNVDGLVPSPVIEVRDRLGRRAHGGTVKLEARDTAGRWIPVDSVAVAPDGRATFNRHGLPAVVNANGTVELRFSVAGLEPLEGHLRRKEAAELRLEEASLNGQALGAANRTLRIRPGERISGPLRFRYSAYWAAAAVVLTSVATWEPPESGYTSVVAVATPMDHGVLRPSIDIAGPREPGRYHLVFAFAAETDGRWIASGTNWMVGQPIWGDGNDLAGIGEAEVARAAADGKIWWDWQFDGWREPLALALTAVEVVVEEAGSGERGQ